MARPAKRVPDERAAAATIPRRRARILKIASQLPEALVEGEGHLSLSVRGKRFAWYLLDHHGDGRVALHCKAEPGTLSALVETHPDRFHVPPYLGSRGWVGLWLDLPAVDWDDVSELLRDAYRLAPAGLRAALEKGGEKSGPGRRRPARKARRWRNSTDT